MGSALSNLTGHDGEKIAHVSLGMIVLDELRFPNQKILYDVPAGSGLYSTVGARIVLSSARSKEVGCLVMAGRDIPDTVLGLLEGCGISLLIWKDPTRLSTRGLLQYKDDDFNTLQLYGREDVQVHNSPIQPTAADLKGSPLLGSRSFHILASPEDVLKLVPELLELRAAEGVSVRPRLVWEPAPLSCVAGSLDVHLKAGKFVDIYSPNHKELLVTFQSEDGKDRELLQDFDHKVIEQYASRILESEVGPAGEGAVVIRCGEHGSLAVSRTYTARRFPAFHNRASPKVVDATGAGNCFLGGFTATYGQGSNFIEAMISGSVAASYAVEQVGPPTASNVDGVERWNDEEFLSRVREYRKALEDKDV